jgi:hypothetical protein
LAGGDASVLEPRLTAPSLAGLNCRKIRFRCVLDDQNTLNFSVAFDGCLKDEALEKYDAEPCEDTDKD